ncbi:MAG: PstC family ABC transporter permease, partial [Turicibacter sanguinis]
MKKDMAINRKRVFLERFFHIVFLVAALFAVISVALIIIFIFGKGLAPFFPNNKFGTYNFIDFITGLQWKPKIGDYGIGYMIVSSIVATLGAIVIGVPIALLTSIFIAEVAPKWLANIVRPAVELLAAIPSVLYGVFGFAVITPMVKSISPYPTGDSLLAVIIVLTIMILPTIVAVVETAIRAVPSSYKEGSLALGASKMQTIF